MERTEQSVRALRIYFEEEEVDKDEVYLYSSAGMSSIRPE